MFRIAPYQYEFVYRRASYAMLQRFNINKSELKLLGAICFYLQWKGKIVCGRNEVFSAITGNSKEKARMMGMVSGLEERGFIKYFEYNRKPASLSVGLSVLGVKVLNDFETVLDEMLENKPTNLMERTAARVEALPKHNIAA